MFFGWFGQVASESEKGEYGAKVDLSFRWSMGWFIFSEVMFFGAFFGALFTLELYRCPGWETWITSRFFGQILALNGLTPVQ